MLEQQARQGLEEAAVPASAEALEDPLAKFFRRAGRAAQSANTDLLEVRARLATLASPEQEERAVLHRLTLAQARAEIRRTVGRHSRDLPAATAVLPAKAVKLAIKQGG